MEHERGDRKYDRNSVRPSSRRSHERQQDIPCGIRIKKRPLSPEHTKWDSGNEAQEYERKNDKNDKNYDQYSTFCILFSFFLVNHYFF